MTSVLNVAAYILEKHKAMTAMKLQKLVYYSQAWSLVWDEEPLFTEEVQAWANGPVIPVLYRTHRGSFTVDQKSSRGNSTDLSESQRKTVDAVLDYYGDKTSQWLSDMTHMESPWLDARKGLAHGERGSVEITHSAMAEYYGSL